MRRVAVMTRDVFLYKKIALCLDGCEVFMTDSTDEAQGADRVFLDVDSFSSHGIRAIRMSRTEKCDLPIPFSLDAPARYLEECAALLPESRSVMLPGRQIRLTELEYSLFSLIVEAGDEPVSREEILERVWHSEADGGIVNVYIHYLREKLEADGERVIAASRGRGYSLTAKYSELFKKGAKDA